MNIDREHLKQDIDITLNQLTDYQLVVLHYELKRLFRLESLETYSYNPETDPILTGELQFDGDTDLSTRVKQIVNAALESKFGR
jgi:hypothetical protein